jgi:hypothetical protein
MALVLDVSREDFIGQLASATDDLDIGLVVSNAGTGNPGEFLKLDRQYNNKMPPRVPRLLAPRAAESHLPPADATTDFAIPTVPTRNLEERLRR